MGILCWNMARAMEPDSYFNFNGTAGILRRAMIEDAGGWQHDTLTEDSDLSYRAQLKGWRFIYVPGLDCPSELPVETHGFQVQQSRWAKGLTQVAKKLLPSILRADIPVAREGGSLSAPDTEHHLPADGGRFRVDAAGHDCPVLYGLGADAADRFPVDHRILRFHFRVLSLRSARALSQDMVEVDRLPAHANGGRCGTHHQQHTGRNGSAYRRADQFRANAEICHWLRQGADTRLPLIVAAAVGCRTSNWPSEPTSSPW